MSSVITESQDKKQSVDTPQKSAKHNRMQQLDILRAVAVLMVLGTHLPGDIGNHKSALAIPGSLLSAWVRCGWAGVDLFFVLSGFLVSGLLFKEHQKYGNVQLGRFLVRRGFKIYPAFYFFLLTTIAMRVFLCAQFGWPGISVYGIVSESLFIQNYLGSLWPHTWSLAVEEHFYLSLGLVIFFLSRSRSKTGNPFTVIPKTFAFIAPAILIVRLIHVYCHPVVACEASSWRINAIQSHLRFDSLLFGVVLSYWWNYYREETSRIVVRRKLLIGIVSSLLISTCLFVSPWSSLAQTFGFSSLYLGFGGVLMLFMQWNNRNQLLQRILSPLARIGFYSYSIYLWHYMVLSWSSGLQSHFLGSRALPFAVSTTIYLLGSISVGIIAAKVIEIPSLKLRDRLFPARSSAT